MNLPEWLDRHFENELEDLAYLMNEHHDAADDFDFLPLGKVQG